MTNPIRGKVARVLNSREIAINVGSEKGVDVGMHFDVLDPKYENIRDPDTQELLGSIEHPKVRVQIIRVQEKLSIASTYRKKKINVGGTSLMGDLSEFLMPPDWRTKYETLKTEEQDREDIKDNESYVKVGDPVAQVIIVPDTQKEDEKTGNFRQLGAVS